MSAPTSHDPLVVNTADGTVWTRREAVRDGLALYAPEKCAGCPEFVMATLPELAELGISGSADALPMPAGSAPRDPVAAGRELDLLALMDERTASVVSPVLGAALDEAERLRARIAELEVENAALQKDKEHVAKAAEIRIERRRARLVKAEADLLEMRGLLSPNGEPRRIPAEVEIHERVAPAVEWLLNRVAELEAERHSTNEALDEVVRELRAQRVTDPEPEGEHYVHVHHSYRLGHDLPETGSTK